MGNAKHTPGPWRRDGGMIYSYANDDVRAVAEVFDGEDDAILIAAAPELLEALNAMLFDFGDFDTDDERLAEFKRLRKNARPIIAKAGGAA